MCTSERGGRRWWIRAVVALLLCGSCATLAACAGRAPRARASGLSASGAPSASEPPSASGPPAASGSPSSSGDPAGPDPSLSSSADPADSTVGPLFTNGMSAAHSCTASVLDSPHQDLILTAAHCLTGSGSGLMFAPGYHDGVAPYGVWTVLSTFADTTWTSGEDAGSDYAILQVADQQKGGRLVGVESVTGGNRLGAMPEAGQAVTVIAYNAGRNDEAVRCDATVRYERGYPTFDCPGFSGGTSGGPWLMRSTGTTTLVVGVIGGPHYGGCVDSTSYSPAFGQPILALLSSAIAGRVPSIMPHPAGDGC